MQVTAKLGKMRKAVEWTIYPGEGDEITIQSDHYIAAFSKTTRKGVMSKYCGSGAYFVHLMSIAGAVPIEVPQELVDECLKSQPKKGDLIGPGVVIG